MKLRSTLAHVAALAATAAAAGACSSTTTATGVPTSDGGPADAAAEASPACGGCNCGAPAVTQGNASPAQACALAAAPGLGDVCNAYCGGLNGGDTTHGYFCTLPDAYVAAYANAQSDAGGGDASTDASPDGGGRCPAWTSDVVVRCGYPCLGRRTDGVADPSPTGERATDAAGALGAVFGERAFLEAVSVHAFDRLERELAFHDAPPALRRAARRARRDEVRHTAMTRRLARRFGKEAELPASPAATPPRDLFAIARENAVEGCVRETYGAVARWITRRLTPAERAAVEDAVREAIADLRARGDGRLVDLLDAHVWKA